MPRRKTGLHTKQAQRERHITPWHIALVVLVASIALVAIMFATVTKEDRFQRAVNDPAYRTAFIVQMTLLYPPPQNIPVIEYTTDPRVRQKLAAIAVHDLTDARMILVRQQQEKTTFLRLLVFPNSFDTTIVQSEQDWVIMLKHEYYHAQQLAAGGVKTEALGFVSSDMNNHKLLIPLLELDALKRDLASNDISDELQKSLLDYYTRMYISFWDKNLAISEDERSSLKVEFFPRQLVAIDDLNRNEVQHIAVVVEESQAIYYLSEEEITQVLEKWRTDP